MFLDEATITVSGGNGGHGCVSWRREKYVPKGGPDGGTGGKGGDVWLLADANTDTLSAFLSQKRFQAENGQQGSGAERAGRSGEDLVLKVPHGTLVTDPEGRLIADLANPGDRVVVASGGRGGYGNAHFKSSVRQRPDFAEKGEPGAEHVVHLELKLVGDVGIIGFPSVGKSTLISVVSSARPKIADYPFTTLVPNLGVVRVDDRSFVLCDVPGLIEGASEGKGLGKAFLKHIERCAVLLHLLDLHRAMGEGGTIDADKLIEDYRIIRNELQKHSEEIAAKKEIVMINKADLTTEDLSPVLEALEAAGIPVQGTLSAATKQGTTELMKKLLPIVLAERRERMEQAQQVTPELPVLRPGKDDGDMGAYTLVEEEDGSIVIRGKRLEQFTKMTNFGSEGGVRRFRDVLDRIGLLKALKKMRTSEETPVTIGDIRIESYL